MVNLLGNENTPYVAKADHHQQDGCVSQMKLNLNDENQEMLQLSKNVQNLIEKRLRSNMVHAESDITPEKLQQKVYGQPEQKVVMQPFNYSSVVSANEQDMQESLSDNSAPRMKVFKTQPDAHYYATTSHQPY